MAERINPQNYGNMINALNTYARQVGETIVKLNSISAACKQVLGDEDIVSKNLDPNIQKIANHYQKAAEDAHHIAAAMEEELEAIYEKIRTDMESEEGNDD
jgi:predicted nucleic acid-binding protein